MSLFTRKVLLFTDHRDGATVATYSEAQCSKLGL